MRRLKFVIVILVAAASMAVAADQEGNNMIDQMGQSQSSPEPNDAPSVYPAESETTLPTPNTDDSCPPKWETRDGVEEAAKAYFVGKREYIQCRARQDSVGMRRASTKMTAMSRKLDRLKALQAKRDKGQDDRLNAHSELVWKHESQLNGKGGLNDRLAATEKGVKTLQQELEAVTPAIAGVDGRFSGLTWWVLALTLIVLIGFTRRFWISR